MKLGRWFALRSPEFIRRRGAALLRRYGLTPDKAQARVQQTTALLARYGCAPTYPTPGRVVQTHTRFIRQLQDTGAEICVHSYDHVDLKGYSPAEANRQLLKAVRTFERYGIEVHGFRCPYLSSTEELIQTLPKGLFKYSSNRAIEWNAFLLPMKSQAGVIFNTINGFYQPRDARDSVSMPQTFANLVETPVCVPDDLQLHDGLQLAPGEIARAWCHILDQIHRRGELFTLVFHPEAAEHCSEGFEALLQEAQRRRPPVWNARLRDIADWWIERSNFQSEVCSNRTGLHISFNCSPRGTILAKGLDGCGVQEAWDGVYNRLKTAGLDLPGGIRPFVGIAPLVPAEVTCFVREQGYILDTGETADRCAIYLEPGMLLKLNTEVKLLNWIDKTNGPLVKYGCWPDGAKSALCITGDLDALSLLDYGSRLFVR